MVGVDEQLGARVRARLPRAPAARGRSARSSKSTAETSTALALVEPRRPAARRACPPAGPGAGRPRAPPPPAARAGGAACGTRRRCVTSSRPLPQGERGAGTGARARACSGQRDRRAGVAEQRAARRRAARRPSRTPAPTSRPTCSAASSPRLELPLARDVGPRLVRVPGQQQPLGDAEARVVLARAGSKLGCGRPRGRGRTAEAASCAGTSAPDSRPCPSSSPIVRSTIFTWR